MAVAKSYENAKLITEPYEQDGKMYVNAKITCPRCGGSGHYSYNQLDGTRCYGCGGSGYVVKAIRWYTDKERAAMDRAAERRQEKAAEAREVRRVRSADRNALGFGEAGYVTLYKGDMQVISDFFKSFTIDEKGHRGAWYNTMFHWFTPSHIIFEQELPEGVEAIRLTWDEVKDPEDAEELAIRDHAYVEKYVRNLTTEPSKSKYQGEIGSWITKTVTVTRNILMPRFGSHMHILVDEDENVYLWTTASKDIAEGTTLNLRMKVKDHQMYNGTEQTVVYYCKEAK